MNERKKKEQGASKVQIPRAVIEMSSRAEHQIDSFSSDQSLHEKEYCISCVRNLTHPSIQKYKRSLAERDRMQSWCASQLLALRDPNFFPFLNATTNGPVLTSDSKDIPSSTQQTLSQYRDLSNRLQKRLDFLRKECATRSVSIGKTSMSTNERAKSLGEQRERVQELRDSLSLMYDTVLSSSDGCQQDDGTSSSGDGIFVAGGSLSDTIQLHVQAIRSQRFRLAMQAFEMHRMDIGAEYNDMTFEDLLRVDSIHSKTSNSANRRAFQANAEEEARLKKRIREKVPSGIGKIGGMPLPHAGQSLYGVLPPNVLTSSLRLVANLTNVLARCLGIILPHPILLRPLTTPNSGICNEEEGLLDNQTGDIIASVNSQKLQENKIDDIRITTMQHYDNLGESEEEGEPMEGNAEEISTLESSSPHYPSIPVVTSSSTGSLLSLVGSSSNMLSRSARRALDVMKGHQHSHRQSIDDNECGVMQKVSPPSMDDSSVRHRLRHSSYAIICESTTHAPNPTKNSKSHDARNDSSNENKGGLYVQYELRSPTYNSNSVVSGQTISTNSSLDRDELNRQEEHFTIGLQLLQNNVMALSLKAGVPIQALWPADAMLLNLHSLKLFFMNQNTKP
jgi:hypothetical protein